MSNIPKSRRKATSLDALALAQNIRSEITTELMLTFGYSEKRLEQHIRKVTDYIQDDALRERAAAQLRETNQDFSIHPKAITRERRKLKAYKRLLDKRIVTMEEIDGYFRSWLSGNYKYMSRDQIYKMNSLYMKLFGRSVTWKKGHGRLRWLMAHPSAA